jgi:hypothetical protein
MRLKLLLESPVRMRQCRAGRLSAPLTCPIKGKVDPPLPATYSYIRVSRFLYTAFVLSLAVATAGAQVVCACGTRTLAPQPAKPVALACAGSGECCHKDESEKTAPVPDHDPCDKCNVKHRTPQAMPDSHDSASTLQPSFDAIPVSLMIVSAARLAPSQRRLIEGDPSPPLLQDLFHTHSLLLI